MHTEPLDFLGLSCDDGIGPPAKYVVLPVPYEGTVSYKAGTAAGPEAILSASQHVEWFDEELLIDLSEVGILTAPPVPAANDPPEQMRRVREVAERIAGDGSFCLALGGEHSITAALVEAVCAVHGPVSVLQIDAHADLRDRFDGTMHSHACVMRRVLETVEGVSQVGIRSISSEEFYECPEEVRNFITPAEVRTDSGWADKPLARLGPKVYVTVDMDGLDPSIAPGVGTPEPGGLTWHEVLHLLQRLCTERQVVGADIVEVCPLGDNHITEFTAARLACKLIASIEAVGRNACLSEEADREP